MDLASLLFGIGSGIMIGMMVGYVYGTTRTLKIVRDRLKFKY